MGRKIPGRKHRGVKDPEKQRAESWAKIKDKVNTAPTNPDDQQVSSSLSRFIELRNQVKQGGYDKKGRKKKVEKKETPKKEFKGKPFKQIPKLEQRPGEKVQDFKRRMNWICTQYIKEAAFEDKYKVDVKRNHDGEVEGVEKRKKDELAVYVKQLKKERKEKKMKKKNKNGEEEKLTRLQRWTKKKAEKKQKLQTDRENDHIYEPRPERIAFGEVAHEPPRLTAPRRVEQSQNAPRPGQKQLLLKSLLDNSPKVIDKKGKRKDLPNAMRRQLDQQQKEVIAAYKQLKANKL